ncbi:LytTR family DNA-binding domain-containing protein [Oerskovia flava]|uniref:LytTR family DNA-binding domain-containing protein n=1 Tax=Oerskovia flava TaxID=2986422 RepID=UPI002240E1C5|nr:LytTR family DNA-binding domain-containing protein [Oerskovia sp. JB1-3-2]
MVQLVCSPKVREKLEREFATYDIPVTTDGAWVLVERGFEVPTGKPVVVFDAIDYMEVVRLFVSGVRDEAGGPRTLTGQSGSTFTVIAPRQVLYLEAAPDGIVACTSSGRYRVRRTLQYYETVYAPIGFIRINKSQLANIAHVKEIIPWFNSRYVLRLAGGEELEVSKTYAKPLRSALKI